MIDGPSPTIPRPRAGIDAALLRTRAEAMEAAFIAEMLGHAGMDARPDAFGGGIGEDQFASFLRQEQASAIVKAGGIGLAETIFRALTGGRDGDR